MGSIYPGVIYGIGTNQAPSLKVMKCIDTHPSTLLTVQSDANVIFVVTFYRAFITCQSSYFYLSHPDCKITENCIDSLSMRFRLHSTHHQVVQPFL